MTTANGKSLEDDEPNTDPDLVWSTPTWSDAAAGTAPGQPPRRAGGRGVQGLGAADLDAHHGIERALQVALHRADRAHHEVAVGQALGIDQGRPLERDHGDQRIVGTALAGMAEAARARGDVERSIACSPFASAPTRSRTIDSATPSESESATQWSAIEYAAASAPSSTHSHFHQATTS